MKISIPNKPVESGGIHSQGEFRIKNSAKAFSILSSGLYSNKHQAILRELGCNAYDSHVEAGKRDVPFTVHLPTRLNPTFFVRDYGVGLDHDGVINIYTTYFESTKQDSNDFVGCMGLGSKSPFSYTDNFSITAIKDGMKRLYSAFINEQGIPSIALMHEEETTEGNGVKVEFAVNDDRDMYRFREETSRVYKWFAVKPEILGQDVKIEEIEYSERDIIPGVHVRKSQNNYGNASYALMGNVSYPIKLEKGDKEDSRRNDIRDMYEKGGLVIEFDIGDLDIAASREELSYIPHTIDSIYRKGEEIIQHLGTYIEKELTGAKTKWDRMAVLNRLHDSNRHLFTPAIEAYIDANPRKFFKYTRFNLYGAKTYFALKDFSDIHPDLQVSHYQIETRYTDSVSIAHRVQPDHIKKDRNNDQSDTISVWEIANDVMIVLQDDNGGLLPRIKEGIKEGAPTGHRRKRVLAFRVTNKDADKDAIYKKVRAILGNPAVILSSTLPKTNTTHLNKLKFSVYQFSDNYGSRYENKYTLKLQTDIASLDHALPGVGKKKPRHVYVPLQHKSIDFGALTRNPTEFVDWLESNDIPKFLGIDRKTIYGINKSTRKLLGDSKEWVNLFDLFKEQFVDIDWTAAREEARRKYIFNLIKNGEYEFNKVGNITLSTLKNDKTPFGKLVAFYLDNKNTKAGAGIAYDRLIIGMKSLPSSDTTEFDKLLKLVEVEKSDTEIKELFTKVKQTYPMLRHLTLNGWNADKNWKDAVEYIKLVDSTL